MSGSRITGAGAPESGQTLGLVLAWAFVGIPLLWGVIETLRAAFALFR